MNSCVYCGGEGKYFLKWKKVWCCCKSHNQCSSNKKKNSDSHKDKSRPPHIQQMLAEMGRYNAYNMTDETKEKLRQKGYLRKHTEEEKRKISIGNKGKLLGRKDSSETRYKKSLATSGEKNPNWRGGISCDPYCFEWSSKEFKEYIKERDFYKCKNPYCHNTSNKLCIHHINYNKKDCFLYNLITLCYSCNTRANWNRDFWRRLYNRINKFGFNKNLMLKG